VRRTRNTTRPSRKKVTSYAPASGCGAQTHVRAGTKAARLLGWDGCGFGFAARGFCTSASVVEGLAGCVRVEGVCGVGFRTPASVGGVAGCVRVEVGAVGFCTRASVGGVAGCDRVEAGCALDFGSVFCGPRAGTGCKPGSRLFEDVSVGGADGAAASFVVRLPCHNATVR
jgi:hypothetical protein